MVERWACVLTQDTQANASALWGAVVHPLATPTPCATRATHCSIVSSPTTQLCSRSPWMPRRREARSTVPLPFQFQVLFQFRKQRYAVLLYKKVFQFNLLMGYKMKKGFASFLFIFLSFFLFFIFYGFLFLHPGHCLVLPVVRVVVVVHLRRVVQQLVVVGGLPVHLVTCPCLSLLARQFHLIPVLLLCRL